MQQNQFIDPGSWIRLIATKYICFLLSMGSMEAQSSLLGSPEIGYIDMTTNLWSAMAYASMLDTEAVDFSQTPMYSHKQIDSLLNLSALPFLTLTRNTPNKKSTLPTILFAKNKNGRLREFTIVHEGKDYFLLCRWFIADPCDCGTDITLFIPSTNTYKNVERPFSLSMKNNLVTALHRYADVSLHRQDFTDTCHVIETLNAKSGFP